MSDFSFPADMRGFRIHMVGVKGTGMTALAEILNGRGAVITGSDVEDTFYTDAALKKIGLEALRFSPDNISDNIGCVINSSAYTPDTNPELAEAVKKHIPCLLYSQALGLLSETVYSCGIAGVHGKTTTTGLAGTVIHELGIPAQTLAGSVIASFGNSCTVTDGQDFFIAETCEYQRHFLSFRVRMIVLTSVESDHQDYYPTYDSIRDAFTEYCLSLPPGGELIYCADDKGACEVASAAAAQRQDLILTPYGEKADGRFRVVFGKAEDGSQHFSLPDFFGKGHGADFTLHVPGRHLALNAAAAAALAASLGKKAGKEITPCNVSAVKKALERFSGGKRRSEILGTACNVVFIDDYGHHPTAVKTTLKGYRDFYPGRKLIVDFMAHTYSRTEALLDEFASCFADADEVIIHKIYASARENKAGFRISGRAFADKIAERHPYVRYYEEVMDAYSDMKAELTSAAADSEQGCVFVTMGAGDNWKLGRKLYKDLSESDRRGILS